MMNHELRAELANAKLMLDRKDIEIAELREELGQCSRELMACSTTLDEKRRELIEVSEYLHEQTGLATPSETRAYERGVAWASGKRDAVPMMGASEMQAMGIVGTPFPMPAPEPGVLVDDLPEEDPNLNTPEGDSDFEVIP